MVTRIALALLLLLYLLPISSPLSAQVSTAEVIDLLDPESLVSGEEMLAWLETLKEHPLDLRTATLEEIASLPTINPGLASAIYRVVSNGESRTVRDLAAQVGADSTQLQILLAFTRYGRKEVAPRVQYCVRTRFAINLQQERGYREKLYRIAERNDSLGTSRVDTVDLGPRFLAPPGSLSTRILGISENLQFGVVFDRDPGETLLYRDTLAYSYRQNERVIPQSSAPAASRSSPGVFLSGHLAGKLGPLKVLLGDYSLSFGSGLQFGRPFGGRKGNTPTRDPMSTPSGARPWRSRSESGYHRGILFQGGIDSTLGLDLSGVGFLSRRFHDGTIDESKASSELHTANIDLSGSLALRTDIRRDDRILETLGGFHLQVDHENGSIGATFSKIERYDRGELRDSKEPIESISLAGIDLHHSLGNSMLFGEATAGNNGGFAASVGWSRKTRPIDATLSLRHFSRTFYSPYGISFAESPTQPHGESGVYLALLSRVAKGVRAEFFVDLYRQSSRDERGPFSTIGSDALLRVRWRPLAGFLVEGMFRLKRREKQLNSGEALRSSLERTTELSKTSRLATEWSSRGKQVRLRLRLEDRTKILDGVEKSGTLFFADLKWQASDKLQLQSRWTHFGGSNQPAQVYSVEGSLPGGVSLKALSGRGQTYYLLLLWKESDRFSLGAKYRETWYADRTVIRPGTMREINGSLVSSLVVQADWKIGG